MKVEDIGKNGSYWIIGNYAKYFHTQEEMNLLKELGREDEYRSSSLHRDPPPYRYDEKPSYKYKYYLHTAETALFGTSDIDISVISKETRDLYWRNIGGLSFAQDFEMRNWKERQMLDNLTNLSGFYKSHIGDMFDLFRIMAVKKNSDLMMRQSVVDLNIRGVKKTTYENLEALKEKRIVRVPYDMYMKEYKDKVTLIK